MEAQHSTGVAVLLSTYNGEKFLPALLDSVFKQDFRPLRVIARDDGSVDGTVPILKEYANTYPSCSLLEIGPRLGVTASFLRLACHTVGSFAYHAFCDQDDIWLPGKLGRAVSRLECCSEPTLYCSRLSLVDENLRPTGYSQRIRQPPCLRNALVENIATGCTVVMNSAGCEILTNKIPRNALFHDWWAYLVLSALGKVTYDPESHILHRQHSTNDTGMPTGLRLWSRRIRRFFEGNRSHALTQQAQEFREIFGACVDPKDRRILDRFIDGRSSVGERLAYSVRPEVFRQRPLDNAILRCLLAIGRI